MHFEQWLKHLKPSAWFPWAVQRVSPSLLALLFSSPPRTEQQSNNSAAENETVPNKVYICHLITLPPMKLFPWRWSWSSLPLCKDQGRKLWHTRSCCCSFRLALSCKILAASFLNVSSICRKRPSMTSSPCLCSTTPGCATISLVPLFPYKPTLYFVYFAELLHNFYLCLCTYKANEDCIHPLQLNKDWLQDPFFSIMTEPIQVGARWNEA